MTKGKRRALTEDEKLLLKRIGVNIDAELKRKRMTAKELANKTKTSYGLLWNYRQGVH